MYIEVFFTDQKSNNLEIGDKINIALVINESLIYKNDTLFSSTKKPNICKRLWILPFAKNMGRNINKNINKNLSRKYRQKLFDHAKHSARDAHKTSSKRVNQKTAETIGDLIENKLPDEITKSSKASPQNNLETNEEFLRQKYISPELRKEIIDDLRLKED